LRILRFSAGKIGEINFDFVGPKDLKVAYGKGKLGFYA
jgi:hypothetical protein